MKPLVGFWMVSVMLTLALGRIVPPPGRTVVQERLLRTPVWFVIGNSSARQIEILCPLRYPLS